MTAIGCIAAATHIDQYYLPGGANVHPGQCMIPHKSAVPHKIQIACDSTVIAGLRMSHTDHDTVVSTLGMRRGHIYAMHTYDIYLSIPCIASYAYQFTYHITYQ